MTGQREQVKTMTTPTIGFDCDISALHRLVEMALAEDIASGDLTGQATVSADAKCRATLLLKEPAVVAGLGVFELVLKALDPDLVFEPLVCDSQRIDEVPCSLAQVQGKARAVLAAERTALNLIQRMCGIATLTRKYVDIASGSGIEILDTRKTTPGLRVIEKAATKIGGGTNHRFGLYDGILIKDNHRAIAGGVTAAIRMARQEYPQMPVEIEVNTREQLQEALALGAERIMLDNMSPAEVAACAAIAGGKTYIEVSGGVNLSNLSDYLIRGVNGISIGALTHSAKNVDISLEFEELSHDKH